MRHDKDKSTGLKRTGLCAVAALFATFALTACVGMTQTTTKKKATTTQTSAQAGSQSAQASASDSTQGAATVGKAKADGTTSKGRKTVAK